MQVLLKTKELNRVEINKYRQQEFAKMGAEVLN